VDGRSAWKIEDEAYWINDRNLQSLGYVPITIGPISCLFLSRQGGSNAMFLSIIHKTPLFPSHADFNYLEFGQSAGSVANNVRFIR
jgi:hypothetical protein